MMLRTIFVYLFIGFIANQSMTFASWAEGHDDARGHNKSTYSRSAILALTKKVEEIIAEGACEETFEQLEYLSSATEQQLEKVMCLPSQPQLTTIISRMTPPEFADHAGLLLACAGKPLTPFELIGCVEKASASYIEHLLIWYPTMAADLQRLAFIVHASLAGALVKAAAMVPQDIDKLP